MTHVPSTGDAPSLQKSSKNLLRLKLARPGPVPPCKGRPAALGASPSQIA
ncbi:hypothetical protein PMI14_07233, partial [Acidovorax sp. CF316]